MCSASARARIDIRPSWLRATRIRRSVPSSCSATCPSLLPEATGRWTIGPKNGHSSRRLLDISSVLDLIWLPTDDVAMTRDADRLLPPDEPVQLIDPDGHATGGSGRKMPDDAALVW